MTPERPVASGRTPAGTAWSSAGTGEPVVLAHGVGMRQDIWAPQRDALARTHRVVAYDLLGHGGSALPPEQATLADYAAQLEELLDALGIDRANVVGHSMGALVALEFALSRPERTLRVAALSAVYERTPEQRSAVQARLAQLREHGVRATLASTLARWFGEPIRPGLEGAAARAAACLAQVRPEGYARTYAVFADADRAHAGRLGALAVPALFATGELDANSTPAMSRAMGREAAEADVVVVPGAGHMVCDTHPDAIDAALRDWLRRPARRSAGAGPPGRAAAAQIRP